MEVQFLSPAPNIPRWRNWQTQRAQTPWPSQGLGSSTLPLGTNHQPFGPESFGYRTQWGNCSPRPRTQHARTFPSTTDAEPDVEGYRLSSGLLRFRAPPAPLVGGRSSNGRAPFPLRATRSAISSLFDLGRRLRVIGLQR